AALLTGLAQILLMRTADHAAVNETVDLVKNLQGKESGFSGLVNAVLRRAARQQETLIRKLNAWPAADLPKWLYDSWSNSYSADTAKAIATTLQHTPMLDISLHPDEDTAVWAKKLEATILPTGTLRRALCDVTNLPGYDQGVWWIQDMAAAIPATLLGDISGKNILDLCAAPGGKTLQLAARGATVTSVDRSKNRLKKLESNLARTNLKAQVFCVDAARYIANDPVDHILLDAPCTATGTLRRNPDVIWTKSPEDVEKLSATQARILDHAFNLLPTGGTLIYCVCSLEEAEGLGQITHFLSNNTDAKRIALKPEDVGGLKELITAEGDLLCLPSIMADDGGMDGFYAARITKG
ncbi:MAG: RsmB/NOP family class I SAM-dependent RNA methyltransferase, partial [Kordiimonadaceae bacterium]|nr:RsmB/NOP family class I SAM-dependent RNA methyltransferase [Kordiimonadaceae bacterium]